MSTKEMTAIKILDKRIARIEKFIAFGAKALVSDDIELINDASDRLCVLEEERDELMCVKDIRKMRGRLASGLTDVLGEVFTCGELKEVLTFIDEIIKRR